MGTGTVLTKMIKTRRPDSSLEPAALAAIINDAEMRQKLGFAPEVRWEFLSTFRPNKPPVVDIEERHRKHDQAGVLYFNIADEDGIPGQVDHHGTEGDIPLCSLDLLREVRYDFLEDWPRLAQAYLALGDNDTSAERLGNTKSNLRSMLQGLAAAYPLPEDNMTLLETMQWALSGVFHMARRGTGGETLFDLDSIAEALVLSRHPQWKLFQERRSAAQEARNAHWEAAVVAVENAEAGTNGKVATVKCDLSGLLRRPIRVVELCTDSVLAAQAARWKRYDLVIVWSRDRQHYRIASSTMFQYDNKQPGRGKAPVLNKWRFDLGQIVKQLRGLEARFSNQRLEDGDWRVSGSLYYKDGTACPLYLADFRSLALHGSSSAWDAPGTKIRHDRVFEVACEALPLCLTLARNQDGKYVPRRVYTRDQRKQPRDHQGNGGQKKGGDALTHHMEIPASEKKPAER